MDATHISKYVFGRPCRLPLLLWILNHPKDRIYQSEPPESLGGRTAIRQELDRFVLAGLLDEERPDGDQRVFYVRNASPLWEIVRSAAEVLKRADKASKVR
jgi:hypothetical protein